MAAVFLTDICVPNNLPDEVQWTTYSLRGEIQGKKKKKNPPFSSILSPGVCLAGQSEHTGHCLQLFLWVNIAETCVCVSSCAFVCELSVEIRAIRCWSLQYCWKQTRTNDSVCVLHIWGQFWKWHDLWFVRLLLRSSYCLFHRLHSWK